MDAITKEVTEEYAKRLSEAEKEKNGDIVTLSPWRRDSNV